MNTYILTINHAGKFERITTHAYTQEDATSDVCSFYDIEESQIANIEEH